MKRLFLMRHGQTLFNVQKRIQGACDSPLTELGKEQAQAAHDYFVERGIKFDAAFSSTQERASDTLEIVLTKGEPYTRLKGIKEWNFGQFEAQPEFLNPKHQAGAKTYGDYFVAYGGESSDKVANRMRETIANTLDSVEGENVIMVSHGGAMWTFYVSLNLVKEPVPIMPNCAIYEYTYENGQFDIVQIIDPITRQIYEINK
ncbi:MULTISPECIES: histidine phosphatase family protein [unclassified Facklamia]|uniref:histidine phosphatase family protein n=1 Tax=Aerococcaceae TaxID=186827 RepID=UPI0013BC4FEE|nr:MULTISPECIES: histidine phosphatase family protein [unclassified Facklamia]NEW64770.1 histidine phosphatase family protein [Facklamia sp. 252]NEW68094.1 histidine phosphatase family protein [Facklamia sp. 253]QQD64926.1 histidine phosphatase family protein [Aerococcaceae bacterium zg-252]